MALTNQRVWWGVRANGSLAREGVSGTAQMGYPSQQHTNLTNSNVAYVFKLTAGSGGGVAQLTWSSGQVTVSSGNVTIDDEGVDFEGETLPTMTHINAVFMNATVCTGTIDVDSSVATHPHKNFAAPGKVTDLINDTDGALTGLAPSGTCDITFDTLGDSITIYVLADTNS